MGGVKRTFELTVFRRGAERDNHEREAEDYHQIFAP